MSTPTAEARPAPRRRYWREFLGAAVFLLLLPLGVAALVYQDLHHPGWWHSDPVAPGPPPAEAQDEPFVPRPPLTLQELADLPSPLDGRRREDILPELLALAGRGDPARAPRELVAVLPAHTPGQACSVAVSPDGRLLAEGSADGSLRLWDMAAWKPGEALPPARTLIEQNGSVGSVAFSPDGRILATGSFANTVVLWDVATGHVLRTPSTYTQLLSPLAFSPDGRMLAAGGRDGSTILWDVRTGLEKPPLRWHTRPVWAVAFSPDGRWLASGGGDHTVQVYEVATNLGVRTFHGATTFTNLAFSPDGRRLFAVSEGPSAALRFWNLETGKETALGGKEQANTLGLAVHPGGWRAATANRAGAVELWDRQTGRAQELVTRAASWNHDYWVDQVAFTPDGRYLATTNANGTVSLFRLAKPGEVPEVPAEAKE